MYRELISCKPTVTIGRYIYQDSIHHCKLMAGFTLKPVFLQKENPILIPE